MEQNKNLQDFKEVKDCNNGFQIYYAHDGEEWITFGKVRIAKSGFDNELWYKIKDNVINTSKEQVAKITMITLSENGNH